MRFSQISDTLREFSHKKHRFLLLALSGVLTGLTLVFTKIGFLEWITLVPAGVVLLTRACDKEVKLRSLYLDGFAFYYSYYLVCYHWFIYLYPLEFIDGMSDFAAAAVVLVAWLGLSLLQALMGGAVFALTGAVCRCRLPQRNKILAVFATAGVFTVFEWTQTIGWWGVPWGRLPIGQSEYLIGLQTASLLGSYFVTFTLVTVNFFLAYALIRPEKLKLGCIFAVSVLLLQYGAGTVLWFTSDVTEGKEIKVGCIQGNISSGDKWSDDSDVKTVKVYTELIVKAAEAGAEIVILPETAFPYDIYSKAHSGLDENLSALAKENGIYLVVGAFTHSDEKNSLNSLVCYEPNGQKLDTVYSKRHLVPFGEYVPMRSLIEAVIPPLADLMRTSEDIDEGEGTNIMYAGDTALGGLICFDSIYEKLAFDSVRDGAEILCLGTNDSWFRDSAALYMHNAQAQLRAIETGRYVVRAANTGISTVINSRGEVLSRLEPLTEGFIVETVYAKNSKTMATVIGNSFVYLLIGFNIFILADDFVNNLKIRRKKGKTS